MSWLDLLLSAIISANGAAAGPVPALSIVQELKQNRIVVANPSPSPITIYYNYVSSFGDLQMFRMKFRDRHGAEIPITDAPGGWFTPHMRYASLRWPTRRRLVIPPGGSLQFERRIAAAVSWASWNRPVEGPCQVQLKLFGFTTPTGLRPIEVLSDWSPSPCPDQPE
jgi:hypothetical protein